MTHIILNPDFASHHDQGEFHQRKFVPCFENPSRVQNIIAAFRERGVDEFTAPTDFGLDPILRVHGTDYVEFLRTIHDAWIAAGNEGDVMPPGRTRPEAHGAREPECEGRFLRLLE